MKIIHALFTDKNSLIYCKKINGLIRVEAFKTPCLKCEKFRGTIQGEGCECEWDDFDFKQDVVIYDHFAEYDRVNDFNYEKKEQRIKKWKKANKIAKAKHENKTYFNPWPLLREFAKIAKNDESDALTYVDQSICYDGIATEDYYDFQKKIFEYREWYSDFLENLIEESNYYGEE